MFEEQMVNYSELGQEIGQVVAEVEKAIVGKTEAIRLAVLTLLCNGHLLIEDIPGVGKTTLAKALARSVGGDFRRIQFTPDLLPADITGSSIFNQASARFEFVPGPVFGNLVLVDEINRATPKTQSALLEAMEERQVTTDGVSRDLPVPFFVVATQNTIEMTGTYPLPEAQLDRFLIRISMGYPAREAEIDMLELQQSSPSLDRVSQVLTLEGLMRAQQAVKAVAVHNVIREYIVEVVGATRDHPGLSMGASPRGSMYVMRAAQVHAVMSGRFADGASAFVTPDDVKAVAPSVLAHRVIPRAELRRKDEVEALIAEILRGVTVPTVSASRS
jgi:MoxR-like ATPase